MQYTLCEEWFLIIKETHMSAAKKITPRNRRERRAAEARHEDLTVTVSTEIVQARDDYTLKTTAYRNADSAVADNNKLVQESMKQKSVKLRDMYMSAAKLAYVTRDTPEVFTNAHWLVDYYGNERLAAMAGNKTQVGVRDKTKSQLGSIIDAARHNYDMVVAAWPAAGPDGKNKSNQTKFLSDMVAIKQLPAAVSDMKQVSTKRLENKRVEEKAQEPTVRRMTTSYLAYIKSWTLYDGAKEDFAAIEKALAAFTEKTEAYAERQRATAEANAALLQNNTIVTH